MATKDKGNGGGNGKGKFKLSRRDFLKLTTAAGAAGSLMDLTMHGVTPAYGVTAANYDAKSTCPYCAVGCGFEIGVNSSTSPTAVVDYRPWKNHPINHAAACPKGQATVQTVNSPRRLGAQIAGYSAPSAESAVFQGPAVKLNGQWYPVSWTEILSGDSAGDITLPSGGGTVSSIAKVLGNVPASARPTEVGFMGSSHMNNEEAYLYRKLIALYGTPNVDHQAQI
jgi:formate dehydrogenase major subunit